MARHLVDKGYVSRYDCPLQTLRDVPWTRSLDYDPEDTVRFYALWLHEAGMITSSPQRIIAAGSQLAIPRGAEEGAQGMMKRRVLLRDWRFFDELKTQLTG